MSNKYSIQSLAVLMAASMSMALSSCIEETLPEDNTVTADQVEGSESAVQSYVTGLYSAMVDYNTYYGSSSSTSAQMCDWGIPGIMMQRESQGEDFPMYNNNYNYQYYAECNAYIEYSSKFVYYFYYTLINNANRILGSVSADTDDSTLRHYRGIALTFRAMAYLDLARMFEWRTTEVADLEAIAQQLNCYNLTVPIVTETTTQEQGRNNPRAPYYEMYRFILTDLNQAASLLNDYSRTAKYDVDKSVVEALQLALWKEIATRAEDATALSQMLKAESDASLSKYDALGITEANDAWQQVKDLATTLTAQYTPLTSEEWHNVTTGFNTANHAWIWCCSVSTQEQENSYWFTMPGELCCEPSWAMPRYGEAYRCISKQLFDQIPVGDWRRTSWIDPDDAGVAANSVKYDTQLGGSDWAKLPKYTNLKFRPGQGDMSSYYNGLLVDMPLIRVEQIWFDLFEAVSHLDGEAEAADQMQAFVNTYRYTDGSYTCDASDFIAQLMLQRRIEFWGEGVNYFDYKRLRRGVTRSYDGSKYSSTYRINSSDGYVAPWMNWYIPDDEYSYNNSIVKNPNPSDAVSTK